MKLTTNRSNELFLTPKERFQSKPAVNCEMKFYNELRLNRKSDNCLHKSCVGTVCYPFMR